MENLPNEINKLRDKLQLDPFIYQDNHYRIINELEINGDHYAIMHKKDDHPDDTYLFRIHEDGVFEMDDELEWDQVVEVVDQWLDSK